MCSCCFKPGPDRASLVKPGLTKHMLKYLRDP